MNNLNQWIKGLTLIFTVSFSGQTFAAGFQISEVSVTGLGRAFAGMGVAGDSISEMFSNPASLELRRAKNNEYTTEVEVGYNLISTSAKFENSGSTQSFLSPAGVLTAPSSGGNSDGGDNLPVPYLYIGGDINERMRYGVGFSGPFGLKTEYDSDWVGRYAAIKSELEVMEINPAITYRIGGHTIAAGLNFINAEAELTRALFTGPGSPDGLVTLEGDDTAVAWNIGVVGENDIGRFGLGYRSGPSIEVDGTVNIAPLGITGGATSKVKLPKTVYLSALLKKSEKLDLLGSIRWTDWSSFENLTFDFDNGLPSSVTPQNWNAVITTSVGFTYRASDTWTYRGGLAYDESPANSTDLTARIPDDDRTWLTLGGSYNANKRVRLDFGFAHILADSPTISESNDLVATAPGAATDNLRGQYTDTDANIFSIAVNIKLGGNKNK